MAKKVEFSPPNITDADVDAVARVMRSGWLTGGPMVQRFETAILAQSQAGWCLAFNSATNAFAAYLDHEYGPGASMSGVTVGFSALTFPSLAIQAFRRGAQIVLYDVSTTDLCADPAGWEDSGVDLMVLTDYAGIQAPVGNWHRGMKLFRDAACSVGMPIGPCDAACLSFYANKPLTTGEGGALVGFLHKEGRELRNFARTNRLHGASSDAYWRGDDLRGGYDVQHPGQKANMTDMNAALGIAQAERLPVWVQGRQLIAAQYREEFQGVVNQTSVDIENGAWAWYPIWADSESQAMAICHALEHASIGFSRHYPLMQKHSLWSEQFVRADLRRSEALHPLMISLPCHPMMSAEDVSLVVETVKTALAK